MQTIYTQVYIQYKFIFNTNLNAVNTRIRNVCHEQQMKDKLAVQHQRSTP